MENGSNQSGPAGWHAVLRANLSTLLSSAAHGLTETCVARLYQQEDLSNANWVEYPLKEAKTRLLFLNLRLGAMTD